MALPAFNRLRRRNAGSGSGGTEGETNAQPNDDKVNEKRSTGTRRHAIAFTCFCYFMAFIFLILVEIGNTNGSAALSKIYFFKLDLANILATAIPTTGTFTLQNSIARTLGLHDFYQVGLWNFCEGYDDTGVSYCSTPQNLYWFNPVEILLNELLSGASIVLPNDINTILTLIRIASNVMFGFFITGLILDFVLIFLAPIVLYSKLWSVPFGFLAGLAALLVTVASIVGTVMSIVFRSVLTSQADLNIGVTVGVQMLAFTWIASGFNIIAFIIHAGLCCCCTSKREYRKKHRGLSKQEAGAVSSSSGVMGKYKLPKFARKTVSSN